MKLYWKLFQLSVRTGHPFMCFNDVLRLLWHWERAMLLYGKSFSELDQSVGYFMGVAPHNSELAAGANDLNQFIDLNKTVMETYSYLFDNIFQVTDPTTSIVRNINDMDGAVSATRIRNIKKHE